MSMSLSTRVARNEAIIFTELDDTVVMMDAEEGRYYELDPVAASVWALLERDKSVAEVCEALEKQYDVAPETCREDVLAFVEELTRLGVVRRADEAKEARV